MTKNEKELAGAIERINTVLVKSNYKLESGHRNNYTAIDIINLKTGSYNNLTAGLTDKTAINYIYTLLKGMELITNPA